MNEPPVLTMLLDGGPGSVRRARERTREFLAGLPDEAAATDAELIVSELVSNACRHAPGPCRLRVVAGAVAVEVSVADTGAGPVRPENAPAPAGYGLRLVAGLTRGIRVRPVTGGKVVHASVPLRRSPVWS